MNENDYLVEYKQQYRYRTIPVESENWSAWTTGQNNSGRVAQEETQIRTLSKEYTSSSRSSMSGWNTTGDMSYDYGDWSDWTQIPIKATATLEVETQLGTEEGPHTVYNYKRYHYYNTDNNRWYNTYGDYQPGYKDESKNNEWQYKTTSKPLKQVATYGGNPMYSGEWFYEETSTEYDYLAVTEHRSRSVTPVYGIWRWGTSWPS